MATTSTDRPDHEDDQLREAGQAQACRRRNRVVIAGSAVLAMFMAVAVLDGVGAIEVVGVDTATVRDRSDGPSATTLTVRHPSVTRPALASPLEITVQQDGGFTTDTVAIAVTTDYLLVWDLNGILPAPAEETADGERTIWTFDVPSGPGADTITIRYEARIEPGRQSDALGRIAVLDPDDPDGAELAAVELTTRIRP